MKSPWCASRRPCEQSWLVGTRARPWRAPRVTLLTQAQAASRAPTTGTPSTQRRAAQLYRGLPCRAAGPPWPCWPEFSPQTGFRGFNVNTRDGGPLGQMLFEFCEFDSNASWATGWDLCLSRRMQSRGIPRTEPWKAPERSVHPIGRYGCSSLGTDPLPPLRPDPAPSAPASGTQEGRRCGACSGGQRPEGETFSSPGRGCKAGVLSSVSALVFPPYREVEKTLLNTLFFVF